MLTSTRAFRALKSRLSVLAKSPYINAIRGVPSPTYKGDKAQLAIARVLTSDSPGLVARLGVSECKVLYWYCFERLCKTNKSPYPSDIVNEIKFNSGMFNTSEDDLDRFAELYLNATDAIDVYAVWNPYDSYFYSRKKDSVSLWDLDPFFGDQRWTLALQKRKVCVVTPFTKTVEQQIPHLPKIHNPHIFRETAFSLVKAPLSNAGTDITGQDWFANLEQLKEDCDKADADVFVIGCGAYGLALAHHIKATGRRALVMGGSTQLLFGIRGNRWDNDKNYRSLMNEYWTRPSEEERPPQHGDLEIKGGAYW